MSSKIAFLNKVRRRSCEIIEKPVAFGLIRDALIAQIQPIFSGREIVDIDIGLPDPVTMKIYIKKEVRKK